MFSSLRLSSSSLFTLTLTTLLASPFISAQTSYQGCYSVDDNLTPTNTSIYQSKGLCGGTICSPLGYAVMGMTAGSQCWCGNSIPATQVLGQNCNEQCPGYPNDTCIYPPLLPPSSTEKNVGGGVGYISVWLTGIGTLEGNAATTLLASNVATTTAASSQTSSNIVYVTTGRITIS
jgi:cell wall integrity and stress response component